MTRLVPRPHYILVFAVRGKRKLGSFYTPTKGSVADYHATLPVWLAEMGPDCTITAEGAAPGSKGFIIDAYEYDPLPVNLWATYRELLPPARVAEIEADARDGDGVICGAILHQDSIFALEEEAHGRQA